MILTYQQIWTDQQQTKPLWKKRKRGDRRPIGVIARFETPVVKGALICFFTFSILVSV